MKLTKQWALIILLIVLSFIIGSIVGSNNKSKEVEKIVEQYKKKLETSINQHEVNINILMSDIKELNSLLRADSLKFIDLNNQLNQSSIVTQYKRKEVKKLNKDGKRIWIIDRYSSSLSK